MMRTIKLASYGVQSMMDKPSVTHYKVLVVKNSTAYLPGEVLREPEVKALCDDRRWDVTVVSLKAE